MASIHLRGVLESGEPGWSVEIDGREYDPEALERVIRWAHEVQFNTLDSILQDRGLLALGESLIKAPEEEAIGDGWSLMFHPILHTMHILAGLKVPFLWDRMDDAEARRQLSEKIQKLGDLIWRERGRTRRP